ncbi:MAG TPA: chorismate-binding protein, partial [Arcobacter skirrowii]|nr:chorismate-binding protein [Aliarcobacter skirrowii]
AAVVALLFATLINTIIPSAIYSLFDILVVICGFVLIRYLKVNIFYIIFVFVAIFLIKDFLL